MRIIKVGVQEKDIEAQLTCRGCSTVFAFYLKEANLVHDRDGNFYTIACPTCNAPCHIDRGVALAGAKKDG